MNRMDKEKTGKKLPRRKLAQAAKRMVDTAMIHPVKLGELSVEEIAKRLNVSTSHLSRAYVEVYHSPLQEYIRLIRFICFKVRAHHSQPTTVKALLEWMDVRSVSHFIKGYKACFGHTPAQFNRQCREKWKIEQQEMQKRRQQFIKK